MTQEQAKQLINNYLLKGRKEETTEDISRVYESSFKNRSDIDFIKAAFVMLGAKSSDTKRVGRRFSIETEKTYLSFTYQFGSTNYSTNKFWIEFIKTK